MADEPVRAHDRRDGAQALAGLLELLSADLRAVVLLGDVAADVWRTAGGWRDVETFPALHPARRRMGRDEKIERNFPCDP